MFDTGVAFHWCTLWQDAGMVATTPPLIPCVYPLQHEPEWKLNDFNEPHSSA
jgi:hypothetical protein